MLSDEEGYGKFLDLHECYDKYINIKGVERLDYIGYIQAFEKLADIPKVCFLMLAAGLWIRIHFLRIRIRIQLFFSMRIRIQQLKKCGSGSSLTKFVTNYFMKC